jgi:hypothetical protein
MLTAIKTAIKKITKTAIKILHINTKQLHLVLPTIINILIAILIAIPINIYINILIAIPINIYINILIAIPIAIRIRMQTKIKINRQ